MQACFHPKSFGVCRFNEDLFEDVKKNLSISILAPKLRNVVQMAIHHVSRRSNNTNKSDLFAKALTEIPPWLVIDYAQLLRYFAGSAKCKQWLIPQIEEWERIQGHVLTNPIRWGAPYDGTTHRDKSVKCLDLSFCTRPNVQNIRFLPDEAGSGMIWISSLRIDGLRIEYRHNNMAALHFRYSLILQAQIQPHWINSYPATVEPIVMRPYIKEYWTEPLEIPLKILKLWTLGMIEDPAQGIKIKLSNELVLQYHDSPPYPKRLFRLFRDLGENAFEKLLEFGCIDRDLHDFR